MDQHEDAIKKALSKQSEDCQYDTSEIHNIINMYDRLLRHIELNARKINSYYTPQNTVTQDYNLTTLFQMIGK